MRLIKYVETLKTLSGPEPCTFCDGKGTIYFNLNDINEDCPKCNKSGTTKKVIATAEIEVPGNY